MGLVSAFGNPISIFLVCCCQMERGCLQHSQGKGTLGLLAGRTSSPTPSPVKVQEKQQLRDGAIKMLRLGEGLASVEKNISSLCIPILGLVLLEHFRDGTKGLLWGARF